MINEAILELKKNIVHYSNHTQKMLADASTGLVDRNNALLKKVIDVEEKISDETDLNLDSECINAIAKFQPMAKNLRVIIAIIKMSSNLERIGDHCVNIAQSGLILNSYPQIKEFVDLPKMKELVIFMLTEASLALVNHDTNIAKLVLSMDNKVDNYKKEIKKDLEKHITSQEWVLQCIFEILNAVNNLERIADLATNICEDVIYMESGKIYRHKRREANNK
ncbi:phosphate signaling complex protein PhoU [Endomicrobium proavitum]|uniref:Phosphate-specific transport system accessory protein PhoU n=1 Tax=Endomicrobium proavitum TaxID=1408281 RepID=A0A0G3WLN6_9BACT|nr:phosphate signaling complex protein PhoU [Endomicrobium proavitum]AKL98414.1 putative Phosphate-specific transport system accessory protein PhoU [Endomicrobium proavitum]